MKGGVIGWCQLLCCQHFAASLCGVYSVLQYDEVLWSYSAVMQQFLTY